LIKALTNLANYRSPIIKQLLIELGYLEIALELVRLMFVTLVKHTDDTAESSSKIESVKQAIEAGIDLIKVVIGAESIPSAGVSQNKIYIVEKTTFLLTCSKILQLALQRPSDHQSPTIVGLFQIIEHLCSSAQQFSKIIATWEHSELAVLILSIMEQTNES
jgi:uncharacterized protein (UPF0212 family)